MTPLSSVPRRVRFARSVRVRIGPERGFLFEQESGHVYSLNASAALAAARMQSGASLSTIVAAVVNTFDVDAATARRDLASFITDLQSEGLAEVE